VKNTVELIGYYGGDLTHAQSAWTSTSRDLTEEKRARIPALLKMLAENGHESPFEKSSIHFLCTVDTVTHYQLLKHRIGVSINTESARYKELKDDKAYIPGDWSEYEQKLLSDHLEQCFQRYHACVNRLIAGGMNRKRAKETARFYLPLANQLTMDIMFNWRSFAHFLRLRLPTDAQTEIRELAGEMLTLVKGTGAFTHTIAAFGF
jgi:thymidylate synthase (FAD)